MDNRWTHSLEEYYTREFRSSVAYAQRPLENDPELAKLAEPFIKIVIPRAARTTSDRWVYSIKPTLCFGDLWDANIQTDAITNKTVLFDPCSFMDTMKVRTKCLI